MRLRPLDFRAREWSIPRAPWSRLIHGLHDCHVLNLGWTLSEVTSVPCAGWASGKIAVIGAQPFGDILKRRLGSHRVVPCDEEALPEASIVVVEGHLADQDARRLQSRAREARCPLILWTDVHPPPSSSNVAEIFPIGGRPLTRTWLSNFLRQVHRGAAPDVAFALAGRTQPLSEIEDYWLCGAFSEWTIPSSSFSIPVDWPIRLDRGSQEYQLRISIEGLLKPDTARRLHVVISTGPSGTGLDLFRQRTESLVPGKIGVAGWELGWADTPGRTADTVLRRLVNARPGEKIAPRLLGLNPNPGEPVLFCLSHATVSLDASDEVDQISLEALQQYLGALDRLALDLASTAARVVVHLSIQGDAAERLERLEVVRNHFNVELLPPLGMVPPKELKAWLNANSLPHTPEELAEASALPYDELIQWLLTRHPEL